MSCQKPESEVKWNEDLIRQIARGGDFDWSKLPILPTEVGALDVSQVEMQRCDTSSADGDGVVWHGDLIRSIKSTDRIVPCKLNEKYFADREAKLGGDVP